MDEDERARLAEFVASRAPALMRVAYLLTGDLGDAEDLLQSALAKTIPRWGSIRHSDPEGYLRAVMYREQVSWWRRLRRRREVPIGTSDSGVRDSSADADLRLALRAALWQLPPRQRTVVVLRYYEDLPEARVAYLLGCSVGTVRSRTHRAITRLRQLLPNMEPLELRR
ncbi:SigE family RNA polymerase sigma factor [Micromonospora andamanensis]|uniref:RNA polymerase sigma24 factor n=1 Tax=Micromonospora andamanensis TaxID=1287068 RepID=A0ABQ4I2E7_9ACTN|nr:SigE family RNA polymerase sigma factor [Micromonospora andamanensis]GIJ12052.1 RNA polymerase sigma24 factor [Micromonospora andamanensis]GIJ43086.1 RNA polymerase sigma24 factor [Micromonospora andamanensis]